MIECKAITNGVMIRNTGVIVPCCDFYPDDTWRKEVHVNAYNSAEEYWDSECVRLLKSNLENDVQDPHCFACWKREAKAETSQRLITNDRHRNASGIGKEMYVEIRFSNLCNYGCYICKPPTSSRLYADWEKLKDDKIFIVPDDHQWVLTDKNSKLIEDFLNRAARISLSGGEIFFDKKFSKYLKLIKSNNKEVISIPTNGSYVPFDLIGNMKNLLLSFSIDGIGNVIEYSRYGSNWETVRSNYEESLRRGIKTNVILTVSLYNIFNVHEVLEYLKQVPPNYLQIGFVMMPDILDITNLHPDLKDEAVKIIKLARNLEERPQWQYAMESICSTYTEEKFNEFIQYTKKLDQLRGINLTNVVPQYRPYYD